MSYKIVLIERCGNECGNALRYPTEEAAEAGYQDLFMRWMACPVNHRIEESDDPVTERLKS